MSCILKDHNMLDEHADCKNKCGECGWNTSEDACRHTYLMNHGLTRQPDGKMAFVTPKVW